MFLCRVCSAFPYRAVSITDCLSPQRGRATRLYLRPAGDPWTQIATMVSDVRTVCPLHAAARRAASHFTNRAYFYLAAQKRHGKAPGTDWVREVADVLTKVPCRISRS